MKTNKLTFLTPTSRRSVIRAAGKRLFSALAALLLWSLPIEAATIVWTNTAGGTWNATNNWSPNQVPTAADEAVITNAGSYTVTLNANATVASLQLGASSGTQTLHCATTTLTLNGPGVVGTNGAFTLAGGTLAGTGTLTVEGRYDWTAGTWQGAGQTSFAPTAIFNLIGSGQKFLRDRTVTIGCNATWAGGQWYGGHGAVVNLQSGVVLEVGSESGAPVWAGAITFNNAGTIRKSTGTGQGNFNWTVNNSGVVDAQTGTLGFYGGGTQTGLFQTAGASTHIHFGGGTHDLRSGVDFTGAGLFTIGDTGTVRAQAALTNGVRWQLLNGGALGGTNSITFTGPFDWQAGTMQESGQTIFSPTATLTLSTTGQKFLRDRAVTIGCPALWSGGQWYGGYGAVVNVQSGATLEVASESGAPVWAGTITLHNAGTIRKSAGAGQSYFNWTVGNGGTVEVQTGTFSFNGGGTQTGLFQTAGAGTRLHFGGGTHDLQAGVSFTGSGLFTIGDTGVVRVQAPLTNGMRWQLLNGGTLGGTNAITFTGPFDWQAGSMQDDGQTIFSPTAALTLSTTGQKFLRDRTVTIGCPALWSGGQWYGGYGAVVNLESSAVLEVASESGAPLWAGVMTLNNAGTIRKSAGAGQSYFNWTVSNGGTVEAQTGTFSFNGGGTQTGLFQTAGAGTRLHFGGGTHSLLAAVDFSGPGLFTIGDTGVVRVQAPLTNGMRWQLLNGGTLGGTNAITFTGPFDWQAGTMQDAGQTIFSPAASLTLSTTGQKFLRDRTVTIGCLALWSGGQWYGGYGAVVNVQSGATLEVASESGAPVWAGTITLHNAGTIRKSAGAGQSYFNWTVGNGGTVEVQTGTFSFNGGGTQTGLFQTAGAGTRLHFGGGTHDLQAGVSFTGSGLFTIGDSGYVRVQTSLLTGVRWGLLNGGTLGGTNSATFTGPFDWQAGIMRDPGHMVFSPAASLTLSTTGQKFLRDRTVTIGCPARWSGGQWYGGYGAVVNVQSGATLDVTSELGAPVWAGTVALNNAGTLRKSLGTGQSYFNWTVTNTAAVRAESGTLAFTGSYVQRSGATTLAGGQLGGATLDIQGGLLTGAGNIAANVLNRADVSPGGPFGLMSVSNATPMIYSNTAAGRFNVQLGGHIPDVDHDQLKLNGTANLAGTLNVELLNSFVPQVGNSFTVMTYTARSGAFANVAAPEGITLQPVYFPTYLVLNAVEVIPVPPYLVSQPTNMTIRAGLTATFHVVAGGSPNLQYQWQMNSTNLPGATSDTLIIPNVTVTNAGSYRVFVSNSGGFTNSVSALLLVEPGMSTVEITTGATNALTGVSFLNGLNGAIIGSGGWLQITHNGGVNWQVVNTGMTEITDVQFVSGAIFIVGAGPHTICVSYDGGLTWSAAYQGPERIRRMRFRSPTYGLAVGEGGAVLVWGRNSVDANDHGHPGESVEP
jgi:hypothetical protein